jgi:hypothetical protein
MSKLTKLCTLSVCVAVLVGWTAQALAQASETSKAQNKLLAMRAARVDALRKLGERIVGLQISSETKVKDFVAESDKIKSAMQAFLQGAEEVGEPRFNADGTCEVTVQIAVTSVVTEMQKLYKEYYKGNKVKIEDFQKITVDTKTDYFKETGSGAPRPELEEPPLVRPEAGSNEASFSGANKAAQEYWAAHCTGRGRLMAERAARLDAMRRLSERINGLMITSKTSVKDFVAENDEIKTAMQAWLKDFKETGKRYHENELIVEVEISIKMQTVYAELQKLTQEYYKGDKIKVKDFESLEVTTKDQIITETGMGVPPEQYLKDVPAPEQAAMNMAAAAPGWINTPIEATGSSAIDTANDNKAQAKLMAIRAAELDARRKLAEMLDGLMISSKTSVKDFVAENDEIKTAMMTFQQGASVVEGSAKVADDGTVTVKVQIDPKPLWNSIIYYEKKLSIKVN